jgi:type IV pilus assembly protein PilV
MPSITLPPIYADHPRLGATQQGVMLLEALISIAIFSIGILGLIGLQSAAIRGADEARQRAVAAFYANQLIGYMWSDDRANLPGYEHYRTGDPPSSSACGFSGAASANPNVKDNWIPAIKRELNGSALTASSRQQVKVDDKNIVTVTLCWKNPEETVFHWFTTAAQIQG